MLWQSDLCTLLCFVDSRTFTNYIHELYLGNNLAAANLSGWQKQRSQSGFFFKLIVQEHCISPCLVLFTFKYESTFKMSDHTSKTVCQFLLTVYCFNTALACHLVVPSNGTEHNLFQHPPLSLSSWASWP